MSKTATYPTTVMLAAIVVYCAATTQNARATELEPLLSESSYAAVQSYAKTLPPSVQQTVDALVGAAASGDIEALGTTIEYNELPPDFGPEIAPEDDAIKIWRRNDKVFGGRTILAVLLQLLEQPPRKIGKGEDRRYVWPAFAEQSLGALSPSQQITLIRLVGTDDAEQMVEDGAYSGWQLMITADGVWHSFTPPEE